MFKELILLLGCLLTVESLTTKCYHTKCKTSYGTYVDCNQRYSRCTTSYISPCQYQGSASYDGYVTCWNDEICTTDYYGQAKCTEVDDVIEAGLSLVKWIIIGAAVILFVGILICCCCCYCMGKACFKGNRNRGRVINSQPVTYNQPSGAVQTTYVPGQGSNMKVAPGHQSPAQYPPAQYPPAQYPPAQYPPAQYPPAQYPPAQYPTAQYPPSTQYPPATGGYPPPAQSGAYPPPAQAGAYPPTSSPYPPSSGAYPPQPPPYSAQPPENPYMKS